MSELPPPLTPPGCNMSGNEWFPWYFDRLRKSRWWRRASDLARARNVMLWGEAFKAAPAGSLADDDDELAEAAGYGMDVEAFLRAKAEIMAPWVLCSDGRWYHPTVCEVVLDAWSRASDRRRKDAARKAEQRALVRNVRMDTGNVPPDTAHVPPDTSAEVRLSAPVPLEITTQTDRTDRTVSEANASSSPTGDIAEPKYPSAFEEVWKAYPHIRGRSSKPKSLGAWRRIPAAPRQQLPSAIARFAREGREPNAECGAPAMERWLSAERWRDWLAETEGKPPPDWRIAVQMAREGKWSPGWGPRPDEPGCHAPADILAEFGFKPAVAA